MKRFRDWTRVALMTAVAAVGAGTPSAQPAGPLMQCTFDSGTEGWKCTGPGKSRTTRQKDIVRGPDAGGVLEYSYLVKADEPTSLLVPTPRGLPRAESMHYWIRTTDYAVIATALRENDGSRYVALLTSIPGEWQEVSLNLTDFQLARDSDDLNNRLDAWQVTFVMLADVTGFFAGTSDAPDMFVRPETGRRRLWLDDVEVLDKRAQRVWEKTEIDGRPGVRLDSFEGPPLAWTALVGGGTSVTYDSAVHVAGESSLCLTYELPAGKAFGIGRNLHGVPLSGMRRLALYAKTETPAKLVVDLRERDGSRYHALLDVAPGEEFVPLEIVLSEMALHEESTDENARLDVGKLDEVLIADVTAIETSRAVRNTLWLDDVVFAQ